MQQNVNGILNFEFDSWEIKLENGSVIDKSF